MAGPVKDPEESQTAFALRMVCEDAVSRERDRIMNELSDTDPVEWALAGSDALRSIVRPIVRDVPR